MRVLVTGASGYVGKSFIEAYSSEFSFEVFSWRSGNLNELVLTDTDVVLHCGALVHQAKKRSAELYTKVNFTDTLKLAKLAKKSGVKHFVFISTIAVYGSAGEFKERSDCHPSTPYGVSKLSAELELFKLETVDFRVSVVRPGMVYGPDAPGNFSSLEKLVQKIPILPFADANNRRSFVYLVNLLEILRAIVLNPTARGIYIATDDGSISTNVLIKQVAASLGAKVYIFKLPGFALLLGLFAPDLYSKMYGNFVVNNSDTMKRLVLVNKYSTKQGIEKTLEGGCV